MSECQEFQKESEIRIQIVSAYKRLPAWMERETTVGKKEGYLEIINQFLEIRKYLYQEEKGLCYSMYDREKEKLLLDNIEKQGSFYLKTTVLYLCALADTMGVMAQEIFELYKKLEGLLREGIRGILQYYNPNTNLYCEIVNKEKSEENPFDISGSFLVSYVILKGCRMRALLSEKYQPIGEAIYLAAAKRAKEENFFCKEEMEMARKEYQIGRNGNEGECYI